MQYASTLQLGLISLGTLILLDPRICQPSQKVRNSKGRMKCYKFYAYYIVEKLIVSWESVCSNPNIISTKQVLYACSDFSQCGLILRKTHKTLRGKTEYVSDKLHDAYKCSITSHEQPHIWPRPREVCCMQIHILGTATKTNMDMQSYYSVPQAPTLGMKVGHKL